MEYTKKDYLKLLSKEFKDAKEVTQEIINLEAILKLPKGTEVFLSDIHGEYEPFVHILNNGAGRIKAKINMLYKEELSQKEINTLATLVYYPEEKLELIKQKEENLNEWYKITIRRLIEVCRQVSTKYTKSKVRKTLPKGFSYIIEELLFASTNKENKEEYYKSIIDTIIRLDSADDFIIEISTAIKQMAIDHVHIVGDIFDRGLHPDYIIEKLMTVKNLDIQWGNHDIMWMGASAGNDVCIANIVGACARYDNIRILEDTYGINMRPLAIFALNTYKEEPTKKFLPKVFDYNKYADSDHRVLSRINKAMLIIQLKLEGQLLKKHPEYDMDHRLILEAIDYKKGTVRLYGKEYKLNDNNFPTVDPNNPYKLTKEEEEIVERLHESFVHSSKLHEHIKFLYKKGSTYKIYNQNLLFHACIPVEENGEFTKVNILGKSLQGKELLDYVDKVVRDAYFKNNKNAIDYMWYLWCGKNSPFFGKDKMTTFEQYFIDEKESHKENKIPYYKYVTSKRNCERILKEFRIEDEFSHIINGHTPVKAKDGESPVRADGKLLVIDGGFAKAYREKTGEAGFTLSFNSYGLALNANKPLTSIQEAIENEEDIQCEIIVDDKVTKRKLVEDTDQGKQIKEQIQSLKALLEAYKKHSI